MCILAFGCLDFGMAFRTLNVSVSSAALQPSLAINFMQGSPEPDGAIADKPVHRLNGILADFSSLPVYRNEIELPVA